MIKLKIDQSIDQNIFYTSDTHYGHTNICRGVSKWQNKENSTRDFSTLVQMNDTLVDGINNTVRENDILFHLGDWSFGNVSNIIAYKLLGQWRPFSHDEVLNLLGNRKYKTVDRHH